MTIKRFVRISQPRTNVVLGHIPIQYHKVRISKLLVKAPVAFQDDSTHYLKISVCQLERNHKDVTVQQTVKPYMFVLPISGCEKGFTSYQNCMMGCWDYINFQKNSEINMELVVTVDDQEVIFDDQLMLELEFE